MENGNVEESIESGTGKEEQEANQTVLQAKGHYAYSESGGMLEESDCEITLSTNYLSLDSLTGQHYEFGYRELNKIDEGNYAAKLALGGGMEFSLSKLGDKYNDFLRSLYLLRNNQLAKDLLIYEGKPSYVVTATIQIDRENSLEMASRGEVRVYKTRLAIFASNSDPFVLRFSDILSFKFENFTAQFQGKFQDLQLKLTGLGEHLSELQKFFNLANTQLLQETNSLIKEVYPTITSGSLLRLSRMLLDGVPVKIKDLNAIEPLFLKAIELQIAENDENLSKSLQYLYSIAEKANGYVGAKKLVTNYLYLMLPLTHKNLVAMETNEKGHATYFFRLESEDSLQKIAGALRDINYRREPIYLSDDDLLKPHYARYRFAINRIESLSDLRKHFVGRALHTDYETWVNQVERLLKIA